MPVLLVELKVRASLRQHASSQGVGVLNMETHLKSIFAENMEDFKQLAEMLAREPGNAPPRRCRCAPANLCMNFSTSIALGFLCLRGVSANFQATRTCLQRMSVSRRNSPPASTNDCLLLLPFGQASYLKNLLLVFTSLKQTAVTNFHLSLYGHAGNTCTIGHAHFGSSRGDHSFLSHYSRSPASIAYSRTAETRKAGGASGAPQAMPPPDEQRPWAQQAQQQASTSSSSSSEDGSAHQGKGAGPNKRGRASPAPSPSQQQSQQQQQHSSGQEGNGEEGSTRRGRPRSRKPSTTPPPSQGSSEQAQGGVSNAGSQGGASTKGSREEGRGDSSTGTGGVGRRSRRTPARSSSPSAAMGQPSGSPPPASSKGRRSRSATNSQ
eukprot:scaffold5056_cov39-Tisochrysis_lutea.AAC.2